MPVADQHCKGLFSTPILLFKQLWYTKPQLSGMISLNSQQGQRSAFSYNLDSLRTHRLFLLWKTLPVQDWSQCSNLVLKAIQLILGRPLFVLHLDKEYNGWTHSRSEARWCKTHSKHHKLGSALALTEHFFLNKGTRYRILYWQGRECKSLSEF